MNKKLLIWVLIILSIGSLALYVADRATAASEQQKIAGDSVQSLQARVAKLEDQVATLQAQVKKLSLNHAPGVIALPGTQIFPENQIPPGAQQHEIGGIKYWTIPLGQGQ
jgi:hypothetical protein